MKKVAEKIDYGAFLELAKQLTEDQYDDNYSNYQEVLDDWAEEIHEYEKPTKIIDPTSSSNLTQVKKDKIKAALEASGNIEVGKFTLKIKRLSGAIEKQKQKEGHLNISIYEKGTNNIHQRVQIGVNDFRFKDAPWLGYFKDPIKAGDNVPIDTVVDIVRWLQAVEKLLIFF